MNCLGNYVVGGGAEGATVKFESVVGGGAGGATVNSRGRSPRYVPPNHLGPEKGRGRPMALSLKMHLDQLGECAASEQAKRILLLKTVLRGPFRADVVGGQYRGLRPRLLTVAPSAPSPNSYRALAGFVHTSTRRNVTCSREGLLL